MSDEAAAEHIRQHIPEPMYYWPVFLVSHFRWLAYRKELARAGARFCLRYPGHAVLCVVRIIDARRPAIFVLENVKT